MPFAKVNPNLVDRSRSRLVWGCLVLTGLVTAITAIYLQNTSSQRRVAKLVGINTYLPLSDSELNEAVKLEYPVGMTEQAALQKLRERGLYDSSQNSLKRDPSEEDGSTEYLVVILFGQQLKFVNKEYLLVLEIDTHSHRIKHSEISYSLTGL